MFWRQRSPSFLSLWSLLLLIIRSVVHAQNISTSGPVPPLQWINITGLTTGSAPPALRDASIGYYEGTRTLLIFGGESAQGIPQSQTFLYARALILHRTRINAALTSVSILTHSHGLRTPLPMVSTAHRLPEVQRSVGTTPLLASTCYASSVDCSHSHNHVSRSAHIVIGGLGANGEALSDVWVSHCCSTCAWYCANSSASIGIRLWQSILVSGSTVARRPICALRGGRREGPTHFVDPFPKSIDAQ